jgi:hypothetical protein
VYIIFGVEARTTVSSFVSLAIDAGIVPWIWGPRRVEAGYRVMSRFADLCVRNGNIELCTAVLCGE